MTGRQRLRLDIRLCRRLCSGWILVAALSGCTPELEVGVVVEEVEAWGLAAAAGIEAGDRIVAWQADDAGGETHDPLELLWIEYHFAPGRGVTLRIDRSGKEFDQRLEDSGWYLKVRPPLDRKARSAYLDALEADDPSAREPWNRLHELLANEPREKRVWAAWREAKVAFDAGRVEQGRDAIQRACASIDRADLRAVLEFELGEGLAKTLRHADAIEPFERASVILDEISASSPLRALVLSRRAAMLASQQQVDEAHRISGMAGEIIERRPEANHLRGQITNNTGIVFHYEGDLETAASYYRRVVEELPGVDGSRRALTGYNLGLIRESQGYYERANELLGNALKQAEELQFPRAHIAAVLNALGILNKNMGAFEQASEHYRRALVYFPRGGVEEAEVRLNLGNLAIRQGLPETAEEHLRAALTTYQEYTPDSLNVAFALHNLGRTLDRLDRLEEAEQALRGALSIEQRLIPETVLVATTVAVLGAVKLRQGAVEEALAHLTRARSLEQQVSPTGSVTVQTLLSLGDAELAAGNRQAAIDWWRQGLQDVNRLREQVPGLHGKARFSAYYHEYHLKLAEVLLEDQQTEEAFLTLERSSARMMRAMLRQQEGRFAMRSAPEIESRRRQLDARIRGVLAELRQLHALDDADRREVLREDFKTLKVEREEITERLHATSPRLERLDRLPEVSIPRIRGGLPADGLGLSLVLGERASFLFVVSPLSAEVDGPGLEVFEIPISRQQVESRVSLFRSLIERGRDQPSLEPALIQQGSRLFGELFGPAADRIESVSRLYLAPDPGLATLPFAALVRSEEPLTFFAEWKPHAIVPSLTTLADLSAHDSPRPRAEYEIVAIGDTDFDGAGTYGTLELGPLPGSRDEVERIAELFASRKRVLLAAEATEAAVRSLLPRSRYVHFATHALLDRRFPLDSSLALTLVRELSAAGDDGLLHGWEIMEGPSLAADLVSLAGCETGLGAEWAGEGLVGMVQAFHYVGVPNVLASQWRVGGAWVAEVTRPFYRHLRSSQGPMDALTSAQKELIHSPNPALRHPFFWASFTLYGASRSGTGSRPPSR